MPLERALCESTDIVIEANGTISCSSAWVFEAQTTSDLALLTDVDMDFLISTTWYVFGMAFIFRFIIFFISKYR